MCFYLFIYYFYYLHQGGCVAASVHMTACHSVNTVARKLLNEF